jgi:xanthine dehydrogenase small subunit
MRDYLLLYINGQRHEVRGHQAFLSLTDYLRMDQGLTGTKIVCSEGDCGACSALLGRPDAGRLQYQVIDACICFMFQLDGTHIITVEGLTPSDRLSAVQQEMIDHFGSQCGFCTPGFVVAMTAMMERDQPSGDHNGAAAQGPPFRKGPSREAEPGRHVNTPSAAPVNRLSQALTGNLCRCTGYVQILEAGLAALGHVGSHLDDLYSEADIATDLSEADHSSVRIKSAESERTRIACIPKTFADAAVLKSDNPAAHIVSGATDIGVIYNKRRIDPDVFLCLSGLKEESQLRIEENTLIAGALCTWTQLEEWSREAFPEFHKIILRFGSPQIRNLSTLVGNIANASPIADSLPLLFVMDAGLELESTRGVRRVGINEFYKGYKQLKMSDDELIRTVYIPLPEPRDRLRLYKISKRNDLDISTFTAAIRLTMEDGTIESARIAYGGVGPVVLRLPRTEASLTGQELTEEVMRDAGKLARDEITPISDVRGSSDYRYQLAENILMKFYCESLEQGVLTC